uniref:Uncharacterized protein n=1 Tax=Picea glauca TaxID=3330 RepID=A0A101LYM9_PICGL|nr:hypothetical protein ABT39_MTgene4770 [Picea glauca]
MEHRAPTWDDRLGCSVGMIGLDTWIGSAPSYRKHPHSLISYNKFYPFRGDTKIYYSSSGHLKWILLSLKVGISGAKPLVLALGRASDESLPQARNFLYESTEPQPSTLDPQTLNSTYTGTELVDSTTHPTEQEVLPRFDG